MNIVVTNLYPKSFSLREIVREHGYVRLHGVVVITKLYFAIFAAFEESMTLNLAQRSFKVIDFGTNRKRVYIFLLVVNGNLDPIFTVSEIAYSGLNVENRQFSLPHSYSG